MHSALILSGLAIFLPVLAEELNAADVPAACTTICGPIVELTTTCDIDPNEVENDNDRRMSLYRRETEAGEEDEEAIEASCICKNTSFDVASVLALCASCISQNGATTDDTDKIMSQCSFSSTSYVASATSVVQGIQVQATKPTTTPSPESGGTMTSAENISGGRVVPVMVAVGISILTWITL